MPQKNWRLTPSDFAFLWEECRCCFYLKVARRVRRPRMAMPKIFTKIDSEMKDFYRGMRCESISPDLPHGVVEFSEKWVQSEVLTIPNQSDTCYIKGKFDSVFKFDDGSYGVVDFKTSSRSDAHIPLYSRQLHAYALALERPAPQRFGLNPVSKLGLLVFEPEAYRQGIDGRASLEGSLSWIGVERDDAAFLGFLSEVLDVLGHSDPPEPNLTCGWCKYRLESRAGGYWS